MLALPPRSISMAWSGTIISANRRSLATCKLTLAGKSERERTSHQIAIELREMLESVQLPAGTSLKVGEPPPGPPVFHAARRSIYGPDAETRRAVAEKVRQAFGHVHLSSISMTATVKTRRASAL